MVIAIKALGCRIKLMVGKNWPMLKVMSMKANRKTIKQMDMENISMSVEPFTLGIGRMINKMDMVSKPGQTIPNMMDTIKKAKKSGNGTYLWLDGSKYSGHWKFNQITGFGVKKTYLNIYELSSNNHFTSEMNFFWISRCPYMVWWEKIWGKLARE